MACDVHQILNGAKPGDIPICQATKFELLINRGRQERSGSSCPRRFYPAPTK
jgi:ABC-type uncharacterized transport system substrate-binding protein